MIVPRHLRDQIAAEHAGPILAGLGPLDRDRDMAMPDTGLLLLCFTNRSGSNLLAHWLAATGAFNLAGEYFNAGTVLLHAARSGLTSLRSYAAHLPFIVDGVVDWLAAKASVDQVMMLADAGILDDYDPVRFVLLDRRDRLGQAISRCIAAQTGRWTKDQAAGLPDQAPTYDRAAIDAERARVDIAMQGFRTLFDANGIAQLDVTYENLVRDPARVVSGVGALTGLANIQADPARVRIERQADETNDVWRARYLAGA